MRIRVRAMESQGMLGRPLSIIPSLAREGKQGPERERQLPKDTQLSLRE